MTALEVEDTLAAAGGIAVAVRTPQEWAAHPHGAATADDPWATTTVTGSRPALRGGHLPRGCGCST